MSAKIRFFMCTPFPSKYCVFCALPAGSGSGRLPCSVSRISLRGAASRSQGCGSLPTAARVISTPLQPNSFYHKSQCTATFQEELSNKYNVNLPHVFVTICNFWKILPFNKAKRTVYSKNSQALHFLYLCAGKRPRPPNGRGRYFTFSLSGGERYRLQPVPALTWTSPTRRRRGCCRD